MATHEIFMYEIKKKEISQLEFSCCRTDKNISTKKLKIQEFDLEVNWISK